MLVNHKNIVNPLIALLQKETTLIVQDIVYNRVLCRVEQDTLLVSTTAILPARVFEFINRDKVLSLQIHIIIRNRYMEGNYYDDICRVNIISAYKALSVVVR